MRTSYTNRLPLIILLFLCALSLVTAQLTNLPNLATAKNPQNNNGNNGNNGNGNNNAEQTTNTDNTDSNTATNTDDTNTDTATTATDDSSASSTGTVPTGSSVAVTDAPSLTSAVPTFKLTGLPTIAGAGIPTMIVPNTKDAPWNQKSSLPEGTVFIAVGAILGVLAFCVVAWRAMVAWTTERSVKRAALASVMSTDDKFGWPSNPFKSSSAMYSHAPKGSSLSLDALTANGKPMSGARNASGRPPKPLIPSTGSGLFFSPTANLTHNASPMPSVGLPGTRSSSYLPAGYYANPAAQVGGGSAARPRSTVNLHSPPTSPDRGQVGRLGVSDAVREGNRMSLRPHSMLAPASLNSQPSNNSLNIAPGMHDENHMPGMRAPSAYMDDLLGENEHNKELR